MVRWLTGEDRESRFVQGRYTHMGISVTKAERDLFRAAAAREVAQVPGATLSTSSWLRSLGLRRALELARFDFLALLRARVRREWMLRWSRGHHQRLWRRAYRHQLLSIFVARAEKLVRDTWRGL